MGLTEYRRKRNFDVTTEPKGGRVAGHKQLSFVIQKHAASHLHYDFRLELDGVLKSWAVPKGPSLNPAQKRLAMHVEDHPIEYGDFEGTIPKGEYGGGTVLLWDRGTWEVIGDAKQGYRDGALKFVLHGKKLRGRWMLVRRGGKRGDPGERNWFLFKERDEFATPSVDITTEMPLSVTTGRSLEKIAKQADRVWGVRGEVPPNGRAHSKSSSESTAAEPARRSGHNGFATPRRGGSARQKQMALSSRREISKALQQLGGKRNSLPKTLSVQLATLTKDAPEGAGWLHEIKFDGYRMLCRIDDGKTRFISRNGRDWTTKFPRLAEEANTLPVANAYLDGEVVVMQSDGTTSFQALQNAFQENSTSAFLFYVFDLLYLNGHDLRHAPIEDRKALLQRIIPSSSQGAFRFSDHVIGDGSKFFAEARRLNLEGIISKRLGRAYIAGRGLDWLKVKCSLREEFVIGGFTEPSGARSHFGAVLLGYYDAGKQLQYAGRVGTGFDEATLTILHGKLKKLVQKQSPFVDLSGHTGQARGVTWIKPSLVAQVTFSNWTNERQLRHPSFQGLREDKAAQDVVREDPVSPQTVQSVREVRTRAKEKKPGTKVRGKNHRGERRAAASSLSDSTDEVEGIHLSHPDKVLYPGDGITKLDLAHYYEQAVPWMLPHVENRLLSLVRCPGGRGEKCFFQKHPGEGTSNHLQRYKVPEKQKIEEHLALHDLPGLIALVQMGVLEIHIWGSRADQFEKPDRLIFDLDPDPSVDWSRVVTAAKEVRLLLQEIGLVSYLKTTGGKGLHLVVPIRRRISWPDAKAFCRAVADFLVATAPDHYIATMSKAARKGKIFVDYLRNDRGATAVAPYSTRARPGATVSVPIGWEELDDRLTSDHFTIHNLPARFSKLKKDPWADIASVNQAITASMLRQLRTR